VAGVALLRYVCNWAFTSPNSIIVNNTISAEILNLSEFHTRSGGWPAELVVVGTGA
jgi:hypothetical protein